MYIGVLCLLVEKKRTVSAYGQCSSTVSVLLMGMTGRQPAQSPIRKHVNSSVIRLSLGKIVVNLLQVVKRTNTPLITLTPAPPRGPLHTWCLATKSL